MGCDECTRDLGLSVSGSACSGPEGQKCPCQMPAKTEGRSDMATNGMLTYRKSLMIVRKVRRTVGSNQCHRWHCCM